MSFVHLHLHTQYSLLDGANKIHELMPRVKELGMPAVAMTDHGNMFGSVQFYKSAIDHGVKPILGCEVYVAPKARSDRKGGRSDDFEAGGNFHLTLLAMNAEGYKNLSKLVSIGYLEGFYYKPRIDKEVLRAHNAGIIALSGCLSSEVNMSLRSNDVGRARRVMEEFEGIFGNRYYVEIQDNKLEIQDAANVRLIELATELGLPMVATNDCHYLHKDDAGSHEVLLCIQSKKSRNDPKAWKLGTHELYVKSPDEMIAAFGAYPESISNTLDIANRCDLELKFRDYQFPAYQTAPEETLEQALGREALEGLEKRFERIRKQPYWSEEQEPEYRDRLKTELEIIESMGFAGYFLIVADFIREAKRLGVPVGPGRGSAAGSLVAYALEITDLDPIPFGLLFERFLNPERKSMPDIDIDFCMDRREEVIQYVRDKYGADRVAQIITFGTLKGKQAIKDVGRVLDFSFGETDKMAKLYPAAKQGRDVPLAEALDQEPKLQEIRDTGDRERELFTHAIRLEGLFRHASKHAAGIVISNQPLVERVPLFKDADDNIITQFSGPDVEEIGLIKFDFLGLKTLTLLDHAVRLIRDRGEEIDLANLPLDDTETYRMLQKGDSVGIFQMESSGMRKLITDLKPSCFEDVIAVLALFRPGPLDSGMVEEFIQRKHGKKQFTYQHPALEEILKETYGVIVYQEQVMQIAQALAGYSLGDADNLRRAMGKKKAEVMAKERETFLSGARAKQLPEALANEIFDQMETFAAYGFNKSHSAAYALISFQTAYLKAHYPREFLAALLTIEMGDTDKTYKNMAECKDRDIRVLQPDINESRADFTVSGKDIRFGMAAVKGVGAKAVEAIVEAREEGPFESLADLCLRVRTQQMNKRVVESLMKCGAFDSLETNRTKLLAGLEGTLRWAEHVHEERNSNQIGLFQTGDGDGAEPEAPPLPDIAIAAERERLRDEKEAIGFFITGHPLDKFVRDLGRLTNASTNKLGSLPHKAKVNLAGVIHSVKLKNNKKGRRYATFVLEDRHGICEIIAWPETYEANAEIIHGDDPVLLAGTLDVDETRRQILANEIRPLATVRESSAKQLRVRLTEDRVSSATFQKLQATLAQHPGQCPCFLHLILDEVEAVIQLPQRVAANEPTIDAVEKAFGDGVAQLA